MKLGIRSQDLGCNDAAALAQRLEDLRLDGVQLVCYKTFADFPYAPGAATAERIDCIRRKLKQKGKEILLIGAYFNPVHSQLTKRQTSEEIFKDYLRVADGSGDYPLVGSETGSYNDDKWTYNPLNRTLAAEQSVAETFTRLARYAESCGAYVGLEGAAGHVCYDVQAMERVVRAVDSPRLKVIFDLYNMLDGENAGQYLGILDRALAAFGQSIHCFHIKDFVLEKGAVRQVPPGKGEFDFTKILGRIKAANKDAILILEGTTGGDIAPSAEMIRHIWNK